MRVLNTEHTPLLTPFPKKIYEIVLGFHPKSFSISSHWSQLCFSDTELQILHMVRDWKSAAVTCLGALHIRPSSHYHKRLHLYPPSAALSDLTGRIEQHAVLIFPSELRRCLALGGSGTAAMVSIITALWPKPYSRAQCIKSMQQAHKLPLVVTAGSQNVSCLYTGDMELCNKTTPHQSL